MKTNLKIDLPVREVITYNKYDHMLAYISVTTFVAMGAMLVLILSL